MTIDQGASNTTTKLYLFGFNNEQVKPPVLTQGYRVGAKVADRLFLGSNSAEIIMPLGNSSFTESTISSGPTLNEFTTSTNHKLLTGEKVVMISDDGDLPENIRTNTVYYAIRTANKNLNLQHQEQKQMQVM